MHLLRPLAVVVAAVAMTLTNPHAGGAQQRLPSTNPTHQIDRNTKDYDVSAEIVFKALESSYRTAGIKPTMVNPATYQISYVATPAGPKVGSSKIENVVNCGGDKKTPLAKTTPLAITVRSEITPRGESSTLKTFVEALPVSGGGDSVPAINCVSNFNLERKLAPEIKLAFRVVRSR